jgi:hypothetical protein
VGRSLYGAVSRRPPTPLDTMVARTEGCTYAANVWNLSIVQGPFSVAPCQCPKRYDSQLLHRCTTPKERERGGGGGWCTEQAGARRERAAGANASSIRRTHAKERLHADGLDRSRVRRRRRGGECVRQKRRWRRGGLTCSTGGSGGRRWRPRCSCTARAACRCRTLPRMVTQPTWSYTGCADTVICGRAHALAEPTTPHK